MSTLQSLPCQLHHFLKGITRPHTRQATPTEEARPLTTNKPEGVDSPMFTRPLFHPPIRQQVPSPPIHRGIPATILSPISLVFRTTRLIPHRHPRSSLPFLRLDTPSPIFPKQRRRTQAPMPRLSLDLPLHPADLLIQSHHKLLLPPPRTCIKMTSLPIANTKAVLRC